MKTGLGTEVDFKPARASVALACFAVVTAVIAWALPKGEAAPRPALGPAVAVEEPARAHGKPICAHCGIVESVQRIETPLAFTGWCDAAEIARTQNSGKAFGRDFGADRESLRETVAAGIAATRISTKDAVTTKHRIVVRLRNGARQVFEETAQRMVHVGDRMVVIAGAPRTNG